MIEQTILENIQDFLEDLFAGIITSSNIRQAYQTKSPPSNTKDDSYIYFIIVYEDDDVDKVFDTSKIVTILEETEQMIKHINVIKVQFICYSNDSINIINKLRFSIYLQKYRDLFKQVKMYPKTSPSSPTTIFEDFNNLWLRRTDLNITFYISEEEIITNPDYICTTSYELHTENGKV